MSPSGRSKGDGQTAQPVSIALTTGPFDAALLSRVEDAGLNASAPPEQRWMDGWLVRYSPGKAKRARCINAVAVGQADLRDKLQRADDIYRAAGLPLIVRITPFSRPEGLDQALADLSLHRFDDTRVMVGATTGDRSAQPVPHLPLDEVSTDDYAQLVGALRGSPPDQVRAHAQRMRLSPVPYRGFVMRRDGDMVACGQFAQEADLVGLYDVFIAPAARNQGLSSSLCRHLLGLAAQQGARVAYLQVDADNHAARAVYRRLGFVDAYGYHYRTRDPASA